MIRALILLVALAAPPRAAHWPVAGGGYVLSTGYPLGMLGFNVCTQVADDTTPDLIGAAADGCNILETSPGHSGAVAITDLDNPLVGSIVWIVGADGVGASTTIADSGNFNLETTWTGTTDNVLELYVQADNDYVEVTRHNGVRYFDGLVTLNGGAVLGADMDTNGQGLTDLTDGIVTVNVDLELAFGGTVFTPTVATDATAYELSFQAGNANHLATVNPDGAPLIECGGIAVKSMAVVQATADQSTITITTVDAAGTYTSTTLTLVAAAPGANEILCETSDAVCGAAIVTYLTSNVPGVTGELVTAQVYLIPSATMCAMGLTSADGGGTKFVLTNGDDGPVVVYGGGSAFYFTQEPGGEALFQIGGTTSGSPGWQSNGANMQCRLADDSANCQVRAASMRVDGTGMFHATAKTEIDFPADNQTRFCNDARTQCFTLGASAADTVTIWDKAGTGAGNLTVTGNLAVGGLVDQDNIGLNIRQTSDTAVNGLYIVRLDSSGSAEFTASTGVQYAMVIVPEVKQTGTALFEALNVSVFDTSSGSGQDKLLVLDWGADGINEFVVQDDGDVLLHANPGSDTAPLDGRIFGANAYAQATGGSRNGASLEEGAGIRALQIVCSDRTLTDTDTITFVVDGNDTVLTESTDFDCFGLGSEDACCLEIAAALVTADIGLTPDAITTAGTIYVTPDEDLLSVDIEYTDGGVDGVGWTLTEGVTGSLNLYASSVNVYDDAGDGAYWREFHTPATKTQPAAAGPTPTVINTATFVYLLDANTEYLYFGMDVHDDWDGSSDLVVEVQVALSGGETANDILNAEIVAEYVGEHGDIDTGIRTQTRTINHDIVSDNGQGDVHHLVFIIDEDLGGHEVAVDDNVSFRFRLDVAGGAGQVAAVWYMGANVKYRTSKPQLETGGTFPSEG